MTWVLSNPAPLRRVSAKSRPASSHPPYSPCQTPFGVRFPAFYYSNKKNTSKEVHFVGASEGIFSLVSARFALANGASVICSQRRAMHFSMHLLAGELHLIVLKLSTGHF